MRFSNLHTHTVFSDGKNTVTENIRSAIDKNMLSLGFSDHSFTSCDTSYCMKLSDYDRYIQTVNTAKAEFKNIIPVFLGIEKDYYSDIDKSAFDYILASVHYIIKDGICYPIDHSGKQQLNCIEDAFKGNVYDFVKYYFSLVCEQAALIKPDVIGHFDVISKFSLMPEDDKYFYIAGDALKETIKHCKCFEINTGAIAKGYKKMPYPHINLLKMLYDLGGEIVINSDCHSCENLDFFFNESVDILRDIGFSSFNVFNGKGFDKVNI